MGSAHPEQLTDEELVARIRASTQRPMRKYTLLVPEGGYNYIGDSRFPLLRLAIMVFKHRYKHWRNGDGWTD